MTDGRRPGCPKRMVFGPCGGVRPDGGCEVLLDQPCVFDQQVPGWPGVVAGPPVEPVPLVLTDFSCAPYSRSSHAEVAAELAGSCDAVLVGEHQNRPDFPPVLQAAMLADAGLPAWLTLACRDRNRVVLEQELVGLRELGVPAVLCVTGDARGPDVRTGVSQVFDLDGTRLAALAASLGVPAAVAETPTAPPADRRGYRLAQKQRAGAGVAVLNYAPEAAVAALLADARTAGMTMPVLASVPVYTDARSAAVLDALPGLQLDHDEVRSVLDRPDPVAAGIATAVTLAGRLLEIPGVVGVNLSGLASERGHRFAARVKAEVGRTVRAGVAAVRPPAGAG